MSDANEARAVEAEEGERTESGEPKCRMPSCPDPVEEAGMYCACCSAENFGAEQ